MQQSININKLIIDNKLSCMLFKSLNLKNLIYNRKNKKKRFCSIFKKKKKEKS